MFFGAITAITIAPALMTTFLRGKIHLKTSTDFAWHHQAVQTVRVCGAPESEDDYRHWPACDPVGHPHDPKDWLRFMPPLNEGDILYMPTTFPNISIEAAKEYMQYQDRVISSSPR